jgi:hypoxia-inducible factor 1-alpha inhibitor (HIF hydroxylase)
LQKPVVITESNIIKPALQKWNLDYLERNLGHSGHTVFVSKNHKFKYYDEKKIYNKTTNTKGVEFSPPTKKVEMRIEDFMKKVKEFKKGDERYSYYLR